MDKLDFERTKITVKREVIASINAYSNKNISTNLLDISKFLL